MENYPSCPACGAPSTVHDVDSAHDTVEVRCIAHHSLVGPRELLAPRLRWDRPEQRSPIREELRGLAPVGAIQVHLG